MLSRYAIGKAGLMGAALALSGCLGSNEAPPTETVAADPALREPGCYTVDLFTPVPINEPAADVKPEHAAFLGEWGNGVWNGHWCHDLLIHTIHADGRVEMLDMHAPSERLSQPASVFKRTGRIREDGSLHFAHGIVTRRYELRDGLLYGFAEGGAFGEGEIILSKKGVVPLPTPRPVRIARGEGEPG